MSRLHRRLGAALTTAATLVAAVGCLSAGNGAEERLGSAAEGAERANPAVRQDGGVGNVAFYYDGTLDLPGASVEDLTAHLGHPSIVVSVPGEDEAGTVEAIHSTGAKAYRYVQFFWAPQDRAYDGIDLRSRPQWAYCRKGEAPSAGWHSSGARWLFLDLNEREVRARVSEILAGYREIGWDGVMFDRGEAATQYAEDGRGRPIWFRRSRCTEDPYRARATFADSFINLLPLARQKGLESMMNTGKSPFDPVSPMRPDPDDRQCRQGDWARCSFLDDAWKNLDLVLSETAARPKAVDWERTFVGNRRSENHQAHGRRTVALITTASLGDRRPSRRQVFYQWSRIKLFDLPVAVGTGDDRCVDALPDAVCNRFGVYPQLVDTTFGPPTDDDPVAKRCAHRSDVKCLWLRRYRHGATVVNVTGERQEPVRLRLGTNGCRYVYDVYRREPMMKDACVTEVALDVPRWSGLPLRFSEEPWSGTPSER